jgi:hypothetical protein
MTNRFPTSVDPSTLFGGGFHPDDAPEKQKKDSVFAQKFWVLVVPVCGVCALVLSVVLGANVFFPAWFVFSLVGYGILKSREEK